MCHQSNLREVLVGPGELSCPGDAAPVPHPNLPWESLQEGLRLRVVPTPVAGAVWTEGLELSDVPGE